MFLIFKVQSERNTWWWVFQGGVDSLVAATLIHRAIGNQLHAVFVDTGLLRKDEVPEVATFLKKHGFKKLHVIDAQKRFLTALKGVMDPEEKT